MATNVTLDRWIVVTVREPLWMPHPSTALFETQSDAQAWADAAVANGFANAGSKLVVKHVSLSEIV